MLIGAARFVSRLILQMRSSVREHTANDQIPGDESLVHEIGERTPINCTFYKSIDRRMCAVQGLKVASRGIQENNGLNEFY